MWRQVVRHPLPAPPTRHYTVSHNVTVDGRLATLFSTFDIETARRNFIREREINFYSAQMQPVPSDANGRIDILEQGAWRQIAEFPFDSWPYAFDVSPDNWCVVAAARCIPGWAAAIPFDSGKRRRPFPVGDGIENLQCDANESFWVGYFDEGVFGSDVLSRTGLHRFSRSGRSEMALQEEYPEIWDCYALNVSSVATWACWYPDFPIACLKDDAPIRCWRNEAWLGSHAFAVDEPHVLFAGGYQDDGNAIALVALNDVSTSLVSRFDAADIFDVKDLRTTRCVGRADRLHVITKTDWFSISVADIVSG